MLTLRKKLDDFKDDLSFIGHKDPGGLEFGDASQRTGTVWVANFLLYPEQAKAKSDLLGRQLDSMLLKTIDKRGEVKLQYVRHHDRTKWWGQPWVMSRDNLTPMLVASVLLAPFNKKVHSHLNQILKLLRKRFGFAWNYKHIWPKDIYEPKLPDLIAPWDLFAMYIRGNRKKYLWPLLLILDLDTLVNSMIRVFAAYRDKFSTSDDLSHQLRLAYKQALMPTPTAWLAKLIYRLRPPSGHRVGPREDNKGQRLVGVGGAASAWLVYYDKERDPPMFEVWQPILKKYL